MLSEQTPRPSQKDMTKWFIASQLFAQPVEKNDNSERGFIYWMTLQFDKTCTFTATTATKGKKDKNTLILLVYRS